MTAPSAGGAAGADVVAALRREGVGDVDASSLARTLYSADASLYRVVPQVVVRPRHREELLATVAVARSTGTPLTMRGAGTSIAGNAVGPGIVVDTSRHLDRVLEVDPEAMTARVEPGVVHAALQRAAAPHGLRFGPDPSTHTRCTIGGMIGNNSCGARALAYGRTVDNVEAITAAFGTGELGAYGPAAPLDAPSRRLVAAVAGHADHVRERFGGFERQGSGYALEHLLPETPRVDRLLVGSEGTLGVVLDATVRLVREEPRTTVVLGFPDMAAAGDAVPGLLASDARVLACEGLGRSLVDLVLAQGKAVPELPRGDGWLLVELAEGGRVPPLDELDRRTLAPAEAVAIWRIREDGAGLAGLGVDGRPAYSGWEDAAVPPDRLGEWLRTFDSLLVEHGLHGVPYGHFGDGCVHVRIDFPFQRDGRPGDEGPRVFRDFLFAAAREVTALGGSISGEHGDGRVRSELLPLMFDDTSMGLFAAVKHALDPDGVLNPGVLVDPAPVDADLRPARPRVTLPVLTDGAHRCTGVGKCLARPSAGVMCPSYAATREEKDSTRGRARVLQEALDRDGVLDGLGDPAVAEALDLCLSCKGCARDCPTGVDMAAYRSEVLDRVWRGRRRPRTHYTLGRLPALLRLPGAGRLGPALRGGPVAAVAKRVAGVDPRRSLPVPAPTPWRAGARRRSAEAGAPDVWLWADTFTDSFGPGIGRAAVAVLDAVGLRAELVPESACCALTWISTGQLARARAMLRTTADRLVPYVDSGAPVVGLEPSCLATLRSDLPRLLPDHGAGARVAAGVRTLAELLATLDDDVVRAALPDLTGVEVVAQPHCHHASILGWEADERLLRSLGADVVRVGGCCGLAGDFGMEQGHYEVSVAVAETQLLPAVRAAGPDAVVLADGLSCRHQLADLASVPSRHLAELLAGPVAPATPTGQGRPPTMVE